MQTWCARLDRDATLVRAADPAALQDAAFDEVFNEEGDSSSDGSSDDG